MKKISDLTSNDVIHCSTKEMTKEIIGYRLKDDCKQYEYAAVSLIAPKTIYPDATTFVELGESTVCFYTGSLCEEVLTKAGVLDLWFAPVYAKEEVVSVGGKFDVKIKDGKIYHKSDDITTFVKDLVGYFNQVKQFGKYSATIKDVTFSKTGCQTEITTLGDWLHVWDMYNKLQK